MQVWKTEKEINMVYIHHRFGEKKTREKKDQRYEVNDIFTMLIYMMCVHHVLLSDNASSPFDLLSDREKQVAMMVVNCQSPQQIADQLFVSVKTINTYRYRIYEKVGVDSDVKLTHLAIRHGLIQS